jgi:hypothetical protein
MVSMLVLVLCLFFLERPLNFTPVLTSPWGVSFWSVFLYFTGSAVVVFAFFPLNFNISRIVVADFRVQVFFFKGFCWILTVCGA